MDSREALGPAVGLTLAQAGVGIPGEGERGGEDSTAKGSPAGEGGPYRSEALLRVRVPPQVRVSCRSGRPLLVRGSPAGQGAPCGSKGLPQARVPPEGQRLSCGSGWLLLIKGLLKVKG